jgi:hypothetical protein
VQLFPKFSIDVLNLHPRMNSILVSINVEWIELGTFQEVFRQLTRKSNFEKFFLIV